MPPHRSTAVQHWLRLTGICAALYIAPMDVDLTNPRTPEQRLLPDRVLRMGMCTVPAARARQGQ
jgi:hypothetical protein